MPGHRLSYAVQLFPARRRVNVQRDGTTLVYNSFHPFGYHSISICYIWTMPTDDVPVDAAGDAALDAVVEAADDI